MVSSVSASVSLIPVLPARSLAWAVMLWTPSPDKVIAVFQAPLLALAVPVGAPLRSLTVRAMVCRAGLLKPPPVVITTAGAVVSRVSASVLLVPLLPARSLAWAVMLWTPSPDKVIAVFQAPLLALVVPIGAPL